MGRADHRKLYVIDGSVAWTGGAGIEDHFENGGFHDVMVRVTGDVVRQAQAAFLTSFHGHGGPLPTDSSAYFPEPAEAGSTPIALAQVIPGGFVAASQAIREQIDGARERLDVMNPYLTDADMLQRILAAARRGCVYGSWSPKSNNDQATAALERWYPTLMDAASKRGSSRARSCMRGRGGRRPCQLRHGEPRLVGALPQLGDHDDRSQPGGGCVIREASVRAGHRPLEAGRAAVRHT